MRPLCLTFDYVLKTVLYVEVKSGYSEYLLHILDAPFVCSDVSFTLETICDVILNTGDFTVSWLLSFREAGQGLEDLPRSLPF